MGETMTTPEHTVTIGPNAIIVDGLPLTICEDVKIELGAGISIVHVGIICKDIQLNQDGSHAHGTTPLRVLLKKEG